MNKFARYVPTQLRKGARVVAPVSAALAGLAALPARAAIDVSDVVTGIAEYSGVNSPIVEIGGAILLVVLTIAAIVWVRRAIK